MTALVSGGKPMVARAGGPLGSSPANIAPAVVVTPPPSGPSDEAVANNFVKPLTLGLAIERWRAVSLVYQGTAINQSTAYWTYLKSLGFTHVRLVLPWRVSVEMFGGWVNGVQPTDDQLDQFLLAARRAVAAGLRVLYDCTDTLSSADFAANRTAIEQVVDRQAAKIAQLSAELSASMIAVGAYSELDFNSNVDCNEFRTAAHRILRARLASHVLMTGCAKNNSPALFDSAWQMVSDNRVILKFHDFPGSVPQPTYVQNLLQTLGTFSGARNGVPVVGASLAEGTTSYDDGWAKIVSLYANYWPTCRPTYWCATDGNWYNFCNSATDPTIRAPLASVVAYANAKIMNSAQWSADNPGVTLPTVPADPTTVTTPTPTTSPGSDTISIGGKVVAGPGSQVFEGFDNGQGLFVQFWHAAGPTLSIQNSIARIDNYPGSDSGDNGAGLYTHPGSDARFGWGYGFFAFKVRHFGGLGYANPGNWAQGSATVLWPGSNEWPGAETDLGEIDSNGKLYYAVHWRSGRKDSNGNYIDEYRLLYVPAPNDTDWGNWHVHMTEWGPGYFRMFIDSKEFAYVDTNSLNVDTSQTSREWQFNDYAHGGQNKPAGFMVRARNVAIECDWFSWCPL
jgi:hypothetical protein